jgi:hypothetical protein
MSAAIEIFYSIKPLRKAPSMKSSDTFFKVSRRAMLSAFAAAPALPVLFPASALADLTDDPLPSWNDTASKRAITTFVQRVTKQGSPEFVPEAERIATLPTAYSIILSARARSVTGISTSIALAVLALINSSNPVGCSIGRSPATAPSNILLT